MPIYNPLISDGRFLYAIIPEKPEDKFTKDKMDKKKDDDDDKYIPHIYPNKYI